MLAFGQTGLGAGSGLALVDNLGVAERGNFFLLHQNLAANGAVLAFGQTSLGAGGFLALVHHFGVTERGDDRLLLENLAADDAMLASRQAVHGAGSGSRGIVNDLVLAFLALLEIRILPDDLDLAADLALVHDGRGIRVRVFLAPLVLRNDRPVANVIAALGAHVASKTVRAAGRLADDLIQLRNVVFGNGFELFDNLSVAADRADLGLVALGLAGRLDNLHFVLVTLRRFAVREYVFLRFAAALAGVHDALCLLAVGVLQLAVVPVMTQLFANGLNLAVRLAANLADAANLHGLFAGRVDHEFVHELMLAGRGDFSLFALFAADGADVVAVAVLAAGGFLALVEDRRAVNVLRFDRPVAEVLAAQLAGVAAKAVHRAGRFADGLVQLRDVRVLVDFGLVDLLIEIASLAGALGVALRLAGRGDNLLNELVASRRLRAFEAVLSDFAAALAGAHDALRLLAVGVLQLAVVPVMAEGFVDFLNLAVRLAANLADAANLFRLGAGCRNHEFVHELVLAGRFDNVLIGLFAADGADVVAVAVLAAGGFLALVEDRRAVNVLRFDRPVAEVLAAQLAGVAAKAVHRAGRFADGLVQLRDVRVLVDFGLVDLLIEIASLAGALGVALRLAGRGDDLVDELVTLRGFAVRDELVAGFAAALAGEHLALRLQAVGLGVNAVVPVVTQRFADFLNLAIRSAADFADAANLFRLGAGSGNVRLVYKRMLAGRGDFSLFGLFAADGANVVAIASLAAGNLLAFITDRIAILVAGLDGDVAQLLAAQLADGTAKTVRGAGRLADHLAQLGNVRVLVDREFLILFDLAAGLADPCFVALRLARRGNDLRFPVVLLRRFAAFDRLCDGFAAALAGVLDAIRARAVGFLFRTLAQIMTQRLADFLNFSDQLAALLAVETHGFRLRAGGIFHNFLALAMLEGRLLVFKVSAQLAGLLHKTRLRAVRYLDDLLGPLMRAARVRVRRERGQHGDEHTQRQYAGIYFPEFHSTTFLSLIPSMKSQLSR